MPRPVIDAKLDSPHRPRPARRRAASRTGASIDHGLHLGYRKGKSGRPLGARGVYLGNQDYKVETIGTADDRTEADGVAVLDWRQAQAKAREQQRRAARGGRPGVEEPAAPLHRRATRCDDYLDLVRGAPQIAVARAQPDRGADRAGARRDRASHS